MYFGGHLHLIVFPASWMQIPPFWHKYGEQPAIAEKSYIMKIDALVVSHVVKLLNDSKPLADLTANKRTPLVSLGLV